MKRSQHTANRNQADAPAELYAPITWRTEDLATRAARVRELVAAGHPRSVASVAAFNELTARRALERARAETSAPGWCSS